MGLRLSPSARRNAFLTVLLPIALTGSTVTLADLADHTGWSETTKWIVPLSLDLLALMSIVEYRNTQVTNDAARRYAKWLGFIALAVSVTGNAIGHLVATSYLTPGPWLVIAVGAIPPLSLGLAAHLAVLATAPVPKGGRRKAPVKVPEPRTETSGQRVVATPSREPKPAPVELHAVKPMPDQLGVEKRTGTDDQILAWITSQPNGLGKRDLMAVWKVGNARALKLLRAAEPAA